MNVEILTPADLLKLRRAKKRPAGEVWVVHEHHDTAWMLALKASATGDAVVLANVGDDLLGLAGLDVVLHDIGSVPAERSEMLRAVIRSEPRSLALADREETTKEFERIADGLIALRNAGRLRRDGKLCDEEGKEVFYA